jgi:hypothetical protein
MRSGMRRPSSDTARRAGLIAVAVALAGALVAARARLADRASGDRLAMLARDRVRAIRGRVQDSQDQSYRCTCGTEYRVSGTDRHRVYWPAGAHEGAPVLGDRCVQCDAPLPAGRVTGGA